VKLTLESVAARHPAAPEGRYALEGIDLAIESGEQLALVGPSGAGKTTLLMVAGLQLKPASGRITIDGIDPWTLSSRERHALRRRLFVAPQVPPLPPRQRVVTTVLAGRLPGQSLFASVASWIYPRDAALAHAVLETMGLGDKLWLRVDRLSGGERQRVALARLLVSRAEQWLVDEPLSALDPALSEQCISVLVAEARKHRATLIASLHQIDLAVAHFPRLVGMSRGRIVFDRAAADVGIETQRALYANEAMTNEVVDFFEDRIDSEEMADAALAAPIVERF
jgi:phosphonate transport system ATP-binding protein